MTTDRALEIALNALHEKRQNARVPQHARDEAAEAATVLEQALLAGGLGRG